MRTGGFEQTTDTANGYALVCPARLCADSGETHDGRALYVHTSFERCVFQYEASYRSWDACVRESNTGPSDCYSSRSRVLSAHGNKVPLGVREHWSAEPEAVFSIHDVSSSCDVTAGLKCLDYEVVTC